MLSRTNEDAAALSEALKSEGYRWTLGTNGLLSTPEARLALACLRRMTDPGDTLANGSVAALELAHSQVNQLTPAEALDLAIGAGNVMATSNPVDLIFSRHVDLGHSGRSTERMARFAGGTVAQTARGCRNPGLRIT